MALTANKSLVRAVAKWANTKVNSGFAATEHTDDLTVDLSVNATTYNHVFAAQYTITASGTQAVDFRGPWTNLVGESVTGAKIVAVLIKVTGNSTLQVEPHGTNGLSWPFHGTAPYIELKPSTGTAVWLHADGTHGTLDASNKQWLLTNTGASTLTVTVVAYIGT